tara:strand:+ start:617 stop:2410 length:1794 start_codon:yes stop_codon:yes gene_type:complete
MIINKIIFVIICILFATNTIQSEEGYETAAKQAPTTIIDTLHALWDEKPERAIRYAHNVLITTENIDKELESKIHHVLGKIYIDIDLPSLSFLHFNESIHKSIAKEQPWNLIGIGNVYNKIGNYLLAKEKYILALDIFKKRNSLNGINGQAVALNCLSKAETSLKNYDNAIFLSKEALATRRRSLNFKNFKTINEHKYSDAGAALGVAYQHGLLADLYIHLDIYDMALEQLQASDSIINLIMSPHSPNNKRLLSKAKQYLGNNHTKKMVMFYNTNNFIGAHVEAQSGYKYLKENPIHLVRHYLDRVDLYMNQDSIYVGLEMIDKALIICKLNGLTMYEMDLLEKKMAILKSNDLAKSALKISYALLEKKKNISDNRIQMLIDNISYKTKLDNNKVKLEKAQSRELLIFIIGGSLMIVLGFIIFIYRNKKISANQELLINSQKKQLIENELKTKETKLIQMSTFIIEKNELLNSINSDLKYHQSLLNTNDKKSLEPLIKKLKSEVNEKADWESFQTNLFAIYPDFIEVLNTKYPSLSTNDIKLCCYIKMNQTTKEIAYWTGLSVRAIENRRYRLRKKLTLKKETKLDIFINSLNLQTI